MNAAPHGTPYFLHPPKKNNGFEQVQSLGVCLAALCIWLQPLDVGTVWTSRGEAWWIAVGRKAVDFCVHDKSWAMEGVLR